MIDSDGLDTYMAHGEFMAWLELDVVESEISNTLFSLYCTTTLYRDDELVR